MLQMFRIVNKIYAVNINLLINNMKLVNPRPDTSIQGRQRGEVKGLRPPPLVSEGVLYVLEDKFDKIMLIFSLNKYQIKQSKKEDKTLNFWKKDVIT